MRFIERFLNSLHRHRMALRYPTCKFYGQCFIENSVLGRYNTIFENVFISGSSIGDFTFIQRNTNVINAAVGKFCSIAGGVRIGLGSHPVDHVSTHPAFYSHSQPLAKTFSDNDKIVCFKKTFIGHDVWIGENALIKDGVTIGTGAVVGAGAVVTKDVAAYSIVVGCPARAIKYRFDEKIREDMLKTAWWDKPFTWLKENHALFNSPEKFLKYNKNQRGENER